MTYISEEDRAWIGIPLERLRTEYNRRVIIIASNMGVVEKSKVDEISALAQFIKLKDLLYALKLEDPKNRSEAIERIIVTARTLSER